MLVNRYLRYRQYGLLSRSNGEQKLRHSLARMRNDDDALSDGATMPAGRNVIFLPAPNVFAALLSLEIAYVQRVMGRKITRRPSFIIRLSKLNKTKLVVEVRTSTNFDRTSFRLNFPLTVSVYSNLAKPGFRPQVYITCSRKAQ